MVDQPVVGLPQQRVFSDKWQKHPVMRRYTTEDVSWRKSLIAATFKIPLEVVQTLGIATTSPFHEL